MSLFQMSLIQVSLLEEARKHYSNAENDYVAVDSYATDIYNGAVDKSISEVEYNVQASKYRELCSLRQYLLENEIERESYIVKETSEAL